MAKAFKYRTMPKIDERDSYPSAPRIPIILKGETGSFETLAILDSGATETSLPRWVADILGLELKDEIEIKFIDRKGKGFESRVSIIVEMEHNSKVELEVPCVILSDGDEVVIGRAGFFNSFEITFREQKREVVLKYLGKTIKIK